MACKRQASITLFSILLTRINRKGANMRKKEDILKFTSTFNELQKINIPYLVELSKIEVLIDIRDLLDKLHDDIVGVLKGGK